MVILNGISPDVSRLQRLYRISAVNKASFDSMAARQYGSSETKVDRLLRKLGNSGVEASRKDVLELFKELEAAGCGELIYGRRGHPTRFRWAVSIRDVGRAAAGTTENVEPLLDGEQLDEDDDSPMSEIEHIFTLRPEYRVTVLLPDDLTTVEASRLADFVRTLPFDQS